MTPWPEAFNIQPLPGLAHYITAFKFLEDTIEGRKFLRSLRELHDRMVALIAAGEAARAARATKVVNPDGPDSSDDSSDQDGENRVDDVEKAASSSAPTTAVPIPTASASTAPVGDVVKNDKPVRDRLSYQSVLTSF